MVDRITLVVLSVLVTLVLSDSISVQTDPNGGQHRAKLSDALNAVAARRQ